MSRARETISIAAPLARVWSVITDYERYPEFLPEMNTVRVVSRHDNVVNAQFELEIMGMRLSYQLRLQEEPRGNVAWSLVESKMMKANNGGWHLEADGDKTKATYALDVELRGLMPKSVRDRLVGMTLPQTLARFKQRAESV